MGDLIYRLINIRLHKIQGNIKLLPIEQWNARYTLCHIPRYVLLNIAFPELRDVTVGLSALLMEVTLHYFFQNKSLIL